MPSRFIFCLLLQPSLKLVDGKKTGDGIFHHLLYLFLSLNVSVPLTGRKTVTFNPQFSALLLPEALIDRFTSDVPFVPITYACSVSTYKIWAPNPINNVVSHFRLLTRPSVWA